MNIRNKSFSADFIVTANRLTDGVVVYFTGDDWTTDIQKALVSEDSTLLSGIANRTICHENLISIELINIEKKFNHIQPVKIRERIRSAGPTIIFKERQNVSV